MKERIKSKRTKKQDSKAETLEERVHRHLSDINSTITDEDIRSVKTDVEVQPGEGADGETSHEQSSDENTK